MKLEKLTFGKFFSVHCSESSKSFTFFSMFLAFWTSPKRTSVLTNIFYAAIFSALCAGACVCVNSLVWCERTFKIFISHVCGRCHVWCVETLEIFKVPFWLLCGKQIHEVKKLLQQSCSDWLNRIKKKLSMLQGWSQNYLTLVGEI